MHATKPLRGQCQHCHRPLQFPADLVGTMADCPHCHQQTELMLEVPPQPQTSLPQRSIVYAVVAVVILLFGLAAAMVALKRAQGLVNRHPQAAPAAATNR